jgi:predicted nicotinamide N-methyase
MGRRRVASHSVRRGAVASRPARTYNGPVTTPQTLSTTAGDAPLREYRLALGDRSWSFLHTGAVVTMEQEQEYLAREQGRLPYGAMLWPACIALAHDLVTRADSLRGKRVLELGAGTGVPGIVAASLGAQVLQVDRSEVALHLCEMNARRNAQPGVEVRAATWEAFESEQPFDFILGADVLYVTTMHERLIALCEANLAPGGVALFSDPFRAQSLPMLEAMEARGWRVSFAKWTITVESGTRTIAVYEASRG